MKLQDFACDISKQLVVSNQRLVIQPKAEQTFFDPLMKAKGSVVSFAVCWEFFFLENDQEILEVNGNSPSQWVKMLYIVAIMMHKILKLSQQEGPMESSQNPVTENRGSWELRGQCLKASVFMSKGAPSSGVSTLQVAQKTRPESDVKEVQLQVNFWEERFETNYSLKLV